MHRKDATRRDVEARAFGFGFGVAVVAGATTGPQSTRAQHSFPGPQSCPEPTGHARHWQVLRFLYCLDRQRSRAQPTHAAAPGM